MPSQAWRRKALMNAAFGPSWHLENKFKLQNLTLNLKETEFDAK